MAPLIRIGRWLREHPWLCGLSLTGLTFFWLAAWLRQVDYFADPHLSTYLEIVGGLIAFTYAANALVRYQGARDRMSLILAFGFVLAGVMELVAAVTSLGGGDYAGELAAIPFTWLVSRVFLALLLLAALIVEERFPPAREAGREIVVAFLVVAGLVYVSSAVFLLAPESPAVRLGVWFPRIVDLLPGALFAAAAWGFHRRAQTSEWIFDRAMCFAAILNVLCHLVVTQSLAIHDAPYTAAQVLKVSSYALVLGGALLDIARLFDRVRRLAVTDSVTGLSNYRRLIEVLEFEMLRSGRTARSFALLLLDLDGLKKINDRLGHVVGTNAIIRVSRVIRLHCRSIDLAARYGGDEFGLVLPETSREAAEGVARRIAERIREDSEYPPLRVSIGVAVYPNDGATVEQLLDAADRALYRMKKGEKSPASISQIAAMF